MAVVYHRGQSWAWRGHQWRYGVSCPSQDFEKWQKQVATGEKTESSCESDRNSIQDASRSNLITLPHHLFQTECLIRAKDAPSAFGDVVLQHQCAWGHRFPKSWFLCGFLGPPWFFGNQGCLVYNRICSKLSSCLTTKACCQGGFKGSGLFWRSSWCSEWQTRLTDSSPKYSAWWPEN